MTEGLEVITYLRPNTQLLRLALRIKELAKGEWNIEETNAEWSAPWTTFPAEFIIPQCSKNEQARKHLETLPSIIRGPLSAIYYTDGSQGLVNGRVQNAAAVCRLGSGISNIALAKCWNIGEGVEVADAETFAVAKALTTTLNSPSLPKELNIFVDSQAAIQRLESCRNTYTVWKARQAASQLNAKGTKVRIQWCPSHVNIPGNEIADRLAKQGLKASPDPESYTSVGHLRRKVEELTKESWKRTWRDEEVREDKGQKAKGLGKLYRGISQGSLTFSMKPKPVILTMPRRALSAYIQLKTGKGYLRSHLKRINKTANNRCFRCSSRQQQDTKHLLLECRAYGKQRRQLRNALYGHPLTLHMLFCTTRGQKALKTFLATTEICTAQWMSSGGQREA